MSDKLSFLDGQPTAEPEVVSAAPAAPVMASEAPRADTTPSATPPAAPAAAPAPVEPHAPISALLDERDKRKAAQERAEGLERQLADWRARAEPQEPVAPEEAVRQALYAQNLRASRRFAEREYGKPQIQAVHDWAAGRCDQDPHFNHQMFSSDDPYEAAYQAFNREKILAEVKPNDLAAFRAWQAAQAAAASQSASPRQTLASTRLVPRSLATAPGNGAAGAPHVPIGPGQAFASAIPR